MTARPMRTAVCPECGRRHRTIHADEDRCLPHRAEGHFPVGMASKADLAEMIQDRICPGGEPR